MGKSENQSSCQEIGSHEISELFTKMYGDLRNIANRVMQGEKRAHTLQPTAIVNEAYIRLAKSKNSSWESEAHFKASAARVMRNVLVDHWRKKNTVKRGGHLQRCTLSAAILTTHENIIELLALDEALSRLEKNDKEAAHLVELYYFGGLTQKEVATALGISERTVRTNTQWALSILHKELNDVESTTQDPND